MRTLLYDGVGNRTAMTVSFPAQPNLAGVTNYAYDLKNQLLSEQSTRAGGYTFSFGYDPAQNPTTFKGQSRTYNANNQLIGTGFAYDGNGNPVLYKGVNLAFDPENRMTAYGSILTAGYNGDGLRVWKQTASGRRYYLYNGEELVCELDAAGNVVAPVVFGANGLVVYRGYLYQFDPQGNAVHVLDDDGRTVLANLAYDAWGQLMSGSNPTPYGYKAQWGYTTDVETGILLLTHRYLDPATGRFLTRDPMGIEGGINLYAYVGNGVVMKANPLGFATWCEVNPRLGIVYDHAFIRFDLIKCDGATTWGFWPGEGKSCPLFPAPGVWRGPDPHEGSCKPVKQITDIRFEKALCDCIKESKRRGRTYQFPCYACGTGVKDMWNCAKARVFPVPPRPSPVFPPDVILPGQCIRLPNGRIICG